MVISPPNQESVSFRITTGNFFAPHSGHKVKESAAFLLEFTTLLGQEAVSFKGGQLGGEGGDHDARSPCLGM